MFGGAHKRNRRKPVHAGRRFSFAALAPFFESGVKPALVEYASTFDLPVIQHAEDHALTEGAQMHEGAISTRLGLRGWPRVAEDVIVARDVLLAEAPGARYHVAHVSTRGRGARSCARRSRAASRSRAEVTPHHLHAHRRGGARLRHRLQGQPAAARRPRTSTRCRAGARRRHHRRHRDRSRAALAASRRTASSREASPGHDRPRAGASRCSCSAGRAGHAAAAPASSMRSPGRRRGRRARRAGAQGRRARRARRSSIPSASWTWSSAETLRSKSKNTPFLGRTLNGLGASSPCVAGRHRLPEEHRAAE